MAAFRLSRQILLMGQEILEDFKEIVCAALRAVGVLRLGVEAAQGLDPVEVRHGEVQDHGPDAGGVLINEPQPEPRKFYIDGGEVEVIGHLVYDLDTDGKKLQVVKYTEYSGRAVRTGCTTGVASVSGGV